MRLGCGQALIPQKNRHIELLAKLIGKCLRLYCLRAQVAGHVQRITDDNLGTLMLAQDTAKGSQILAAIGANQGQYRLCRRPALVGNGYSHTPVPYVESHNAGDEACRGLDRLFHQQILSYPERLYRDHNSGNRHKINQEQRSGNPIDRVKA
jgi:hypothetical protein